MTPLSGPDGENAMAKGPCEWLASPSIPEARRPILASRQDLTPISIELREKDLVAMDQLQQPRAGPRIPQPGRMIPGGCEDVVSVRTELY